MTLLRTEKLPAAQAELAGLLGVGPGLTALIGGGGKTTAMYLLARELCRRGTVICCTSTRILPPPHLPVLSGDSRAAVGQALAEAGCVCLGAPAPEGKLGPPALDMAALPGLADYVLVEADGSRGLPLKAHLPHEPVIPDCAAQTVLLAGASGFGRPIREAVHRPERYCALSGASPGDTATPRNLAAVLAAERLGDRVFVNQADTAEALALAGELAALLPWPVCAGSLQGGKWTCLSSYGAAGISPPA